MDLNTLTWRKSSHSDSNGGHCVELAAAGPAIALRDSKHPDQGALSLTASSFTSLLTHLCP
ncbi:hypothetical protein GCM10027589_28300 [Actinocorallia lasiicapitis]